MNFSKRNMTLRNVTYVRAESLTKAQKKELGIDESISTGIIAVETHNDVYTRKGVLIKKGVVDYILNG
jgi:hypothetical protein